MFHLAGPHGWTTTFRGVVEVIIQGFSGGIAANPVIVSAELISETDTRPPEGFAVETVCPGVGLVGGNGGKLLAPR